MSFRLLSSLLVAIAMLVAPLGMPAMAKGTVRMPAAAAAHHGQMAGKGHCDEQQPQPGHPVKAADKNCCAAMCHAMVVPPGMAELPAFHAPRERFAPDRFRPGYLSEIATPPPRTA